MAIKYIVVRGGTFDLATVFSVAVLRELYPYAGVRRSNRMDVLEHALQFQDECVFVGIGPDLDCPSPSRSGDIPYSEAGRIWEAYGMQFVERVLGDTQTFRCTPAFAFRVARHVELTWVYPIDIEASASPSFRDFPAVRPLTLAAIVDAANPVGGSVVDCDAAFDDTVVTVRHLLRRDIINQAKALSFGEVAQRAIDSWGGNLVDPIVFDEEIPNWRDVAVRAGALFVVMPWFEHYWQVLPVFDPRIPEKRPRAPESWHGLCNDDLVRASGVSDAHACHPKGYAFSASSKEGAIRMARIAASAYRDS